LFLTGYFPYPTTWVAVLSDAWFHAASSRSISGLRHSAAGSRIRRDAAPVTCGSTTCSCWCFARRRHRPVPVWLINIQALLALGVGGLATRRVFRRTFAHRRGAVAVLLLGSTRVSGVPADQAREGQ
jgi:hypothetical protein